MIFLKILNSKWIEEFTKDNQSLEKDLIKHHSFEKNNIFLLSEIAEVHYTTADDDPYCSIYE